jgi:hypothetical protein
MGSRSDWFELGERAVAPQDQKCPFPSFDAPPRSSRLVVEDKDYVPDDRNPDTLPPDKILLGIPDVIRTGGKSYDIPQEAQSCIQGSDSYSIRQLSNLINIIVL